MKISLLCSDPRHPVVEALRRWQVQMRQLGHEVSLHFSKKELTGGDILFLVSCSEIVTRPERARFRAALVLHASDLPQGKGWSPHVWSVIVGASVITVCLIEAANPVDSGKVWLKASFTLEGHELLPEINEKLFRCEIELMTQAVKDFPRIVPRDQDGGPESHFRRRTPADSRLDVHKPIAEQFDLLRVVDNDRFPAFFELRGRRYILKIVKADDAAQS